MSRFRRITVIIITALIALAMLSSAAFIAVEADHDCTGENCAVCCAISFCVNTFKSIAASFIAAALFALVFTGFRMSTNLRGVSGSFDTPVNLKTKLLN